MRSFTMKRICVPVLVLIVAASLLATVTAAVPQDAQSELKPRPRAELGAACECRCCWKSAGEHVECNARFHEFLLQPERCGIGCTAAACTAHFGATCSPENSALHATCRRAAPRVFTLLFFVGAAIALLAVAVLRAKPNEESESAELDELSRRSSSFREPSEYGAVHVKMASDIPFIVPPESHVSVRNSTPLMQ